MPTDVVSPREFHRLARPRGSAREHDRLVSKCCELLELVRWPHFRVNQKPTQRADGSWHSPGADAGAADIMSVVPGSGLAVFIECKTGEAQPREAQRIALDAWANAGAMVLVVRSAGELHDAIRVCMRAVADGSR